MSVYFSLILADVTLIATLCTFYDKFLLPYVNNHLQERDLTSFVDRILETRTVIDSINNGQKIIYITGRPGIGKKFFLYKLRKNFQLSNILSGLFGKNYPISRFEFSGTDIIQLIFQNSLF